MISGEELDTRFTYHSPNQEQKEKYTRLRSDAHALAVLIDIYVPDSREKSLALTKLEEAVMWANAGVARRT